MMLKSFRVRLALLAGLLALAVAGALSYRLGTMLTAQMLTERGDALRGIGEGVGALLAEELGERRREINLLAQSGEAQRIGLAPAAWRAEIERVKKARAHYAWIGVADVRGIVISASDGLLVGQDVTARPWFRAGLVEPHLGDVHGAKLLSSLLPPGADGEPLRFVDFSAPLRGPDGRVIGVLAAHADWRWARDVIEQFASADVRNRGVQVYVLDSQGRTIHDPTGRTGTTRLEPGALAGPTPALLAWTDGDRSLTVGTPLPAREGLPSLGWTVVVRQPESIALHGVSEAQHAVWFAGAMTVALAMSVAWAMAGHFSRPLRAISDAAERIEAGDHGHAIPVSTGTSELEGLSRALSGMTRHLIAREAELQELSERLEARVVERTADLAAANAALAQANADLDRLAHIDGLTGLQNRRAADMLLKKELAQHRRYGRTLGVLLCDIDHFKRVNDVHGHASGDRVLKAVAQCLQASCRESDGAARFGGEEFVVILPETDAAGAAQAAEKIRLAVAAVDVPRVGSVTLSIGAAVAVAGRGGAHALLQRADAALYAAKDAGRNRVVVAAEAPVAFEDTVVSEFADLS